jgi:hypothetical protein
MICKRCQELEILKTAAEEGSRIMCDMYHERGKKLDAVMLERDELKASNEFLVEAIDAAIKDREYYEALAKK